ncbi:cytochrome c oxidase subunit II [Methylosinus sporium]|uniref:Cytochrome c oxidase subunit 2 n=1 Tax=Methylosinus sporium TaxID=428 RepID=A0A549SS73_METSR|nr:MULTISPECIES: cytochrome c oxidase subunit II [Methylosinus]MBU3888635.1 cytochrome c oxidase subunit II [Methylosinus sp. KRF6]TRL32447.1 cytochrome c oxidase subunit II [Methylosinus sporium]
MLIGRRPTLRRAALTAGAVFSLLLLAGVASAEVLGQPTPGGLGLPATVTEVGAETQFFYNVILLPIISFIGLFVLGLLIYVCWRFNEHANPVPSKLTHHTGLEVVWTLVPVLILVFIAIPSFRLLAHQVEIPEPKVTIKVTGNQWYWSYAYPEDQGGGFSFDQFMKTDADLKPENGDVRLLSVDNEAVVPVGEVIKLQVVASDVIHSYTIPAFTVRIDAVPGRLNETWFKAEKEGIFYGQCSKICGKDHAFMPAAIRVVSKEKYAEWLVEAKKKFAKVDDGRVRVAAEADVR